MIGLEEGEYECDEMRNTIGLLLLWKLCHGSCLTHELEKPLSPEVKGRYEKLAKGKKLFFQNQAEKLEYSHGGLWR